MSTHIIPLASMPRNEAIDFHNALNMGMFEEFVNANIASLLLLLLLLSKDSMKQLVYNYIPFVLY